MSSRRVIIVFRPSLPSNMATVSRFIINNNIYVAVNKNKNNKLKCFDRCMLFTTTQNQIFFSKHQKTIRF